MVILACVIRNLIRTWIRKTQFVFNIWNEKQNIRVLSIFFISFFFVENFETLTRFDIETLTGPVLYLQPTPLCVWVSRLARWQRKSTLCVDISVYVCAKPPLRQPIKEHICLKKELWRTSMNNFEWGNERRTYGLKGIVKDFSWYIIDALWIFWNTHRDLYSNTHRA